MTKHLDNNCSIVNGKQKYLLTVIFDPHFTAPLGTVQKQKNGINKPSLSFAIVFENPAALFRVLTISSSLHFPKCQEKN